ncbi:flavin monoamine oxidase family protein [Microbacterium hominis]|uniref:FAD-dependent oxidoreductase n=1 Tax=Microbacterium hominis TaxID=162426 RepID=A0A7D4Q6J4_9MICO|nr:NAD(P)/FAD-dependent oxidoreductase [Microbacterium hominis]QKJ18279.1 FAD-dependent oxidoreductase [Microbacterium hominis]
MYDTVVVGAGIAGITAARLLQQQGRRVVVLEARDRIGGRLWTDRTAGFSVDRGASWIHGIDGNPLADIVAGLGMRTAEFTVGAFQAGGRPIANYDEQRRRLDDDSTRRWVADVDVADEQLRRSTADSAEGATYAQVAGDALARLPWDAARASRVAAFYRHRIEEQCGADIGDAAARALDEDVIDGDEVIFPDGYDALAQTLARGLDIRIEHVVTTIDWSTTGVSVRTAHEQFDAGSVIVTVPLGVLKARAIEFDPELPAVVSGPIDRVGMGVFNKVFLQFPEKFWPEGVYAIRQLGEPSFPWHSWYDVSAVSGEPMLLTFAGGQWARRIEKMADAEIVDSVLEGLRSIYGPGVPSPAAHWITRWSAEEFTRGSYSYIAAPATHEDHDAMATPVAGVVHLAGEATWSEAPATVHGALFSGHRAAERVLGRSLDIANLLSER